MKKIVEKNEISIPKALNLINSYHKLPSFQNENYSTNNLNSSNSNSNLQIQRPSTNNKNKINEYGDKIAPYNEAKIKYQCLFIDVNFGLWG